MLQKRNEMIMKQMVDDTSYYKSLGLTIEEVFELIKKVYREVVVTTASIDRWF